MQMDREDTIVKSCPIFFFFLAKLQLEHFQLVLGLRNQSASF